MPSWLPGDDYMTNFRVGDPYVQIDDGYARLPGAGYEALHPELKGLNPEDYPDIHKLRILADVAPYSREYNQGSLSCPTQKLSRTRGRALMNASGCLRLHVFPFRPGLQHSHSENNSHQNSHRQQKSHLRISLKWLINYCFYCLYLVGPEGFEPPTKGL